MEHPDEKLRNMSDGELLDAYRSTKAAAAPLGVASPAEHLVQVMKAMEIGNELGRRYPVTDQRVDSD